MPRPRHPLPLFLGDLRKNLKTGRYEITDYGITYSMGLYHTRLIKSFYKIYNSASIAEWYDKLDKETKKEIYREGDLPETTFFYYDGHHLE